MQSEFLSRRPAISGLPFLQDIGDTLPDCMSSYPSRLQLESVVLNAVRQNKPVNLYNYQLV